MLVMNSKIRWMATLLGMVALMSCGSGAVVTAPVTVSFPVGKSLALTSITLKVSGSDMTTITSTQTGPFGSEVWFDVDVPVGSSRTFAVTASIPNVPFEGFHGSATADISAAGGSVPITMLFVNFSSISTATLDGPKILSLSALYDNSDVAIYVDFAAQVNANTIAGVVEFIPNAATSSRSQSIINQFKGAVDVTIPSPGSNFIMFNGTGAGGTGSALAATLYDSNDTPIPVILQVVMNSPNTIEIRMPQTAFANKVDAAIDGKLNVLVGSIPNPAVPFTPTFSGFVASSAAVGTNGGNVILYNATFNTSTPP